MLSEERFNKILALLNDKGTLKVAELAQSLNTSESTIRRDLTILNKAKKLRKIHGGATTINTQFALKDDAVILRNDRFHKEKTAIGNYAASLIEANDFVYIDAGTSTAAMIDFINQVNATFVTNGLDIAKKLIHKKLRTIIIGGEIKPITDAVIGNEAINGLAKYHFTKGFFGTNGIDYEAGFSTPDANEAQVKKAALTRCKEAYILADPSKFNLISPVRFGALEQASIITTVLPYRGYEKKTKILEVNRI